MLVELRVENLLLIERAELRLGDGLIATIALVQVARSEIPPETDAVEEAARRMGMAT